MHVPTLKAMLTDLQHLLEGTQPLPLHHIGHSIVHFQLHWHADVWADTDKVEACFANPVTKRWWKRENYEPLDFLLKGATISPDFVYAMFKDLFDESKELEGRVGRCVFHFDMLLEDYRAQHPRKIFNNHYHSDYEMMALYLTLRFPEKYAPYQFRHFQSFMEKVGSRDIPQVDDMPRYQKMLGTLQKWIDKEPSILAAWEKRKLQYPHLAQAPAFLPFLMVVQATDWTKDV